MVTLVQRVNLPVIFQPAGNAAQVLEGSEQSVQQDQRLSLAGNTVIQFNAHTQATSGYLNEPDTLPPPVHGARENSGRKKPDKGPAKWSQTLRLRNQQ